MSFAYKVMTEQDAMKARYHLLDDGDYDAVIKEAIAKLSAKGNHMIECHIDVYDKDGCVTPVRDYLIISDNMMWKTIHCADSAGLMEAYSTGKFNPDMLRNANVRVTIGTQAGQDIPVDKLQGKPPGSKYPDKNVVKDYVKRAAYTPKQPANAPDFNDNIPF